MKKLIIVIVILISAFNANAQDMITTKNGEKLYCRVEKIGEASIKYKLWNTTLSQYETNYININKIKSITYESGEVVDFTIENKNDKKYYSAINLHKHGQLMFWSGIGGTVFGTVLTTIPLYSDMQYGGAIALCAIGGAMVATSSFLIVYGIIYTAAGKIKMYEYSLFDNNKTSLNMACYGNGIGIKLKF